MDHRTPTPGGVAARRLATLLLATLLLATSLAAAGCASGPAYAPSPSYEPSETSSHAASESESYEPRRPTARSRAAPPPPSATAAGADSAIAGEQVRPDGAPVAPAPPQQAGQGAPGRDATGQAPGAEPQPEPQPEAKARRPLLIYTGSLVLAIYDVASTQEQAIALVEERGGFVQTRASDRLILRVPAADFRTIFDALAGMGDVIDMSWNAQDVTEAVRDLNIRLQNAIEIRNRLQELLERADDVEDALAIEHELERVTLEIERIQGQLRSFEERIAFSTIDMYFRALRVDEIPADDYLIPFSWLNQLGVERLMRIPEVR